jgi:hypothetical protein
MQSLTLQPVKLTTNGDSQGNSRPQPQKKTDIVTMNAALLDGFLENLPKAIRKITPIKVQNMVFLHMFNWFIPKYNKTKIKDRKEN